MTPSVSNEAKVKTKRKRRKRSYLTRYLAKRLYNRLYKARMSEEKRAELRLNVREKYAKKKLLQQQQQGQILSAGSRNTIKGKHQQIDRRMTRSMTKDDGRDRYFLRRTIRIYYPL